MLHENLENIQLNTMEYGFLMKNTSYNASSFPIKIPKLFPLAGTSAKESTIAIDNNNIFVNAPDCKPTVSSTIKTSNYINVPKLRNANLSHKVPNYPDSSTIPSGTRFLVMVMNENINDIYITDSI